MQVKVADGGMLKCDHEVPGCVWNVHGAEFTTTLRLFPLGCYDIILGMDWLQNIGSMAVHWGRKQLTFQHQGELVELHRVTADRSSCHEISVN